MKRLHSKVLSVLLVLLLCLQVASFFHLSIGIQPVYALPVTAYTMTNTAHTGSMAIPSSLQRGIYYANGRWTEFFIDGSGYLDNVSSTDGTHWSVSTNVMGLGAIFDRGYEFSSYYNGTYLYLIYSGKSASYALKFVRATINSNGYPVWGTAHTVCEAGVNSQNVATVTSDSNGSIWVSFNRYYSSANHINVTRFALNGGTGTRTSWLVNTGGYTSCILALNSGATYCLYYDGSSKILGRYFDGNYWQPANTTTSSVSSTYQWSATVNGTTTKIIKFVYISATSPYNVYYMSWTAPSASWSSTTELTTGTGSTTALPSISVNNASRTYVYLQNATTTIWLDNNTGSAWQGNQAWCTSPNTPSAYGGFQSSFAARSGYIGTSWQYSNYLYFCNTTVPISSPGGPSTYQYTLTNLMSSLSSSSNPLETSSIETALTSTNPSSSKGSEILQQPTPIISMFPSNTVNQELGFTFSSIMTDFFSISPLKEKALTLTPILNMFPSNSHTKELGFGLAAVTNSLSFSQTSKELGFTNTASFSLPASLTSTPQVATHTYSFLFSELPTLLSTFQTGIEVLFRPSSTMSIASVNQQLKELGFPQTGLFTLSSTTSKTMELTIRPSSTINLLSSFTESIEVAFTKSAIPSIYPRPAKTMELAFSQSALTSATSTPSKSMELMFSQNGLFTTISSIFQSVQSSLPQNYAFTFSSLTSALSSTMNNIELAFTRTNTITAVSNRQMSRENQFAPAGLTAIYGISTQTKELLIIEAEVNSILSSFGVPAVAPPWIYGGVKPAPFTLYFDAVYSSLSVQLGHIGTFLFSRGISESFTLELNNPNQEPVNVNVSYRLLYNTTVLYRSKVKQVELNGFNSTTESFTVNVPVAFTWVSENYTVSANASYVNPRSNLVDLKVKTITVTVDSFYFWLLLASWTIIIVAAGVVGYFILSELYDYFTTEELELVLTPFNEE